MIIVNEREIPERFADKFSKCCKCGKHPVIKSYFDDVSGDKYDKITCPNDECNIEIDFDRRLSELVDRWNKKNSKDWGKLVFCYGDIIKKSKWLFKRFSIDVCFQERRGFYRSTE